jgi:hypothetical protein
VIEKTPSARLGSPASDPNPLKRLYGTRQQVESARRDHFLTLFARVTGGIHQKAQRPTSGQSPPRSQYFDLSAGPPPFLGESNNNRIVSQVQASAPGQ